jgi:heat shock protein HtpX
MSLFLAFVIAVGYGVGYYLQSPVIVYIAIAGALFSNVASYWFSDKIALAMAGAKKIEQTEYPDFYNSVENLSKTAGLPMPQVYIINDPAPNAFATGRDPKHAAVAATTGLLALLEKKELEGVVAHELAHIANRDTLLQTVVVIATALISNIANFLLHIQAFGGGKEGENRHPALFVLTIVAALLAPFAAMIIQLAISRKREFLADASGALLTRYPEGLASALQKISGYTQPIMHANPAMAHLYISNPLGGETEYRKPSFFEKLFMTHPPTEERVAALLNQR